MVNDADRSFGRREAPDDPRDANYPLRAALAVPLPLPRYNYWDYRINPLDQGSTGTCVAHGGKNFLLTEPVVQVTRDGPPTPFDMYRQIVLLDEFADNDFEATAPDNQLQMGTSTRALCKWLVAQGYMKQYRRAFNIADIAEWLAFNGPILLGVPWKRDMMHVDGRGYVRAAGPVIGGHFVLLLGVNFDRRDMTLVNSWGHWGIAATGRARISFGDVERLVFAEGGEAYAGLEVPLPPA